MSTETITENETDAPDYGEFEVQFANTVVAPTREATREALEARRFDPANPPPRAIPRLYLSGQGICTSGNLTGITGQAKSGKSATVSAILATTLDGREHLAIKGKANDEDHAVIHFDTEQSRYDHHQLVVGAMKRAGAVDVPSWLRSYSLADIPTEKRREYLASECTSAVQDHGGIHLIIVDGVADLCIDPNDPKEAFGLVEQLHQLAITFDCPIIVILHLNPGSEFKTRGHLGSQLERKAESVVALERERSGDAVTIYLKAARHGYLRKDAGPCFTWDNEKGRHELIQGTRREIKAEERRKMEIPELKHLAGEIVNTNGPRIYGDFIKDIQNLRGATVSTAKGLFTKMREYRIISQDMLRQWELSPDQEALP